MGTDNLFRKQKKKAAQNTAHRQNALKSYGRILIVCEGEKTEPNYFKELKKHYKINPASVTIRGEGGSSPKSVVDFAEDLYEQEKQLDYRFKKVFCVFDRNSHPSYKDTVDKLRNMEPKGIFVAITSVPAFEYWFLLHYTNSAKPYAAKGSKSAGDNLISDLKKYLPGYTKNRKDIFSTLIDRIETAKTNAASVLRGAEKTGAYNPSTNVHKLVDYLQNIKL